MSTKVHIEIVKFDDVDGRMTNHSLRQAEIVFPESLTDKAHASKVVMRLIAEKRIASMLDEVGL